MCGIVGMIGAVDAVPICFEGLQRLEYRGYDSAGVAVVGRSGLRVHKRAGRVDRLVASAPKRLKGSVAIGHTRWATHGEPTDANAHPHTDASGTVAVVHNGIVDNASELRAGVLDGVAFASDTDTEVLAHLIARELTDGVMLEDAVRAALGQVEGAYGLAVVAAGHPDRIVVARNGSPVLLGIGAGEMLVASDTSAFVRHVDRVVHLEDREMAVLTVDGFRTMPIETEAERGGEPTDAAAAHDRGDHPDFMHKEIFEQPTSLRRAVQGRLDRRFSTSRLGGIDLEPRDVIGLRRVKVLGCGSALYAAMAGALAIEQLARIPADAEAASEFRYRNPVIEPDTLYIAVSQSGETFDTLAAVHEIRRKGGRVLGVVNTPGSSIARACATGVHLHAGAEVSVTSTKTFTSTAAVFMLLALHLARVRDLGPADGKRVLDALERLPDQIEAVLADEAAVADAAATIADADSAFFVGRVRGFPVALEGAQKLKEVSYIHAEAYPSAELKHGPLALVCPDLPSVVVVPDDDLLDKNLATIAEIRARSGPVIAVTDCADAVAGLDDAATVVLRVPPSTPEVAPILLGIPLQLLAYHSARLLGRDIDRPRNLAKSVTVE
jgi:glutamine---fructose-6-phosphate transaminase (isomerizing)